MAKKTDWNSLNENQQAGIVLLAATQVGLFLFAQGALLGRPKEFVRGRKWVWFLTNFINFFGPIAYLTFGKRRTPRAR